MTYEDIMDAHVQLRSLPNGSLFRILHYPAGKGHFPIAFSVLNCRCIFLKLSNDEDTYFQPWPTISARWVSKSTCPNHHDYNGVAWLRSHKAYHIPADNLVVLLDEEAVPDIDLERLHSDLPADFRRGDASR